MQTTASHLRPALTEVRRAEHDQDLIEIPKRAKLDREAEKDESRQPLSKSYENQIEVGI